MDTHQHHLHEHLCWLRDECWKCLQNLPLVFPDPPDPTTVVIGQTSVDCALGAWYTHYTALFEDVVTALLGTVPPCLEQVHVLTTRFTTLNKRQTFEKFTCKFPQFVRKKRKADAPELENGFVQ